MNTVIKSIDYTTALPFGSHWSLRMRRNTIMRINKTSANSNIGMLFYNPENLFERYNAPDTLKCQHTFKLTTGNCLYSDMGRIFASIVDDSFGWHDTVCGNSHQSHIEEKFGKRDYQSDLNDWYQNGHDAFVVEMEKYGLTPADMAANVNWFSKVVTDAKGNLSLAEDSSETDSVTLRFDMDTLVILHTCPHPMSPAGSYPTGDVKLELGIAHPVADDDVCLTACEQNARGFQNNALYYLGA